MQARPSIERNLHNVHEDIIARQVIQKRLKQSGSSTISYRREIPVDSFRARIDIAFFGERIEFFEIKSAADSLSRLPSQLGSFRKYCDKLHLVVASIHLDRALDLADSYTEVWESRSDERIRIAKRGKAKEISSSWTYLDMVTSSELKHCLGLMGFPASRARRRMMDNLAICFPRRVLRNIALYSLRRRYGAISHPCAEALGLTISKKLRREVYEKAKALRPVDKFKMTADMFPGLPIVT